MVSENMGLPFYRGGRGGRGRRTGHNINFLGKCLFLIIYVGKLSPVDFHKSKAKNKI